MKLKKNFGLQKGPTINIKKNFGFRFPQESEATGKKKVFDFKMNLSKLSKPKFSTKDASEKDPTISTMPKFKRNPFAKKIANSDKDLEKAISAALEGEEKLSHPKPAPLREKFVGFTKSASQSMKVAAKSTPQKKRPVISFNKHLPIKSEEESISFEEFDEKNITAGS